MIPVRDTREYAMPRWAKRLRNFGHGAQNALEIIRGGRFSAPYRADYEVVDETEHAKVRRYPPSPMVAAPFGPLLLVPPLMVTSEVYDISPELSSVTWLRERGVDVWLVDYGAPEQEEGGMKRTLDDHVLAVDRAIDVIRRETGKDVHVGGYSQGGMFVYQTAAYRKCEGIASLITFGSPVDIHRNLPALRDDVAGRLIKGATTAVAKPLKQIEGLPGFLTSTGFKMLSARKEAQQVMELFTILHDREALGRREKRRRFLGGEGFVAWPGPALRTFVDEFIVNNRMADGGFVVNGQTVTLASIDVPILCVIGGRDEIARPAAVQAIHRAAPDADIRELIVPAGHFGIVVGSRSLAITWPTVREWMNWVNKRGDLPAHLAAPEPVLRADEVDPDEAFEDLDVGVELFYDLATDMVEGLWSRLGDASESVGETVDVLRWQLPRIAKLRRLTDESRVSLGKALSEQAKAIPDATFFLWKGRAFTYAQADERVGNVAKGLWMMGVRPGQRVAIVMGNRPTLLSLATACSRIGAVAALVNPDACGTALSQALEAANPTWVVVDPEHTDKTLGVFDGDVHVLGGGTDRSLPERAIDMEAIEVTDFEFASSVSLDAGLGGDLAMLMFTSGTTGLPKAARITNRRWALAALGTAAGCRLTSSDTVYCALPLHHSTAMLVAVGGALVGGARLALAPRFSTSTFWDDVGRYGVTAVIYVGEMCRYLVNAPETQGERDNPVRVFAGNGMRADVWERLDTRFQPERIVEFYGSTEGNVILANLTGTPVGSVGRPLPGSTDLAVVRYELETSEPTRNLQGRCERSDVSEPGLVIGRIVEDDSMGEFDGYVDARDTESKVLRNVFADGDAWFNTGDLLSCDESGDWWFADRIGDTYRYKGENVSTEFVRGVIASLDATEWAAVYGVEVPGQDGRTGMAAVKLADGAEFDGGVFYRHLAANLTPSAMPRWIRVMDAIELTPSFKVRRAPLAELGADGPSVFAMDADAGTYRST